MKRLLVILYKYLEQSGTCWAHAVCNSLESQCLKKKFTRRNGDPLIFSRKFLIESRNQVNTYEHAEDPDTVFFRIKNTYRGILLHTDMPKTVLKNGGFDFEKYQHLMRYGVSDIVKLRNIRHRELQEHVERIGEVRIL